MPDCQGHLVSYSSSPQRAVSLITDTGKLTMNGRRHRTPTGIILWLDDKHNEELLTWEVLSLHGRMEGDRIHEIWRSLSLQCNAETVLQKPRDNVLVAAQAPVLQRPACSGQSLASGDAPLILTDNKLIEFTNMQYSSAPLQANQY